MTISREDVLGWARQVGIEVHERKQQARVGLDVLFGDDSTEKLQRMCELAAEAERRKHQADIEAWKAEAATAEKWRGMALAKDPMQPGKAVQEIQREAMEREREACAVACEDRAGTVSMFGTAKECAAHNSAIDECAAAIRARGVEHSAPKMCQAEPENVPADSSAGAALRAGGTSWPASVPESVPSGPAFAEFMLGKPITSPDCWCETCDSAANHGLRSRMSLCPQCGNKRCPRATHHDNACTGSNDPGQKGSSWEHVKPASDRARGQA